MGKIKERKPPSERDQRIFQQVKEDLLDYLYKGLAGRFQIAGHRFIEKWAQPYLRTGFILEIGCGHGHHLALIQNQYDYYFGLDIEYNFLKTLRSRFPGKKVVNGDAYSLPFRDGSIDCILSIYNFEHLRKLQESLSEIYRVLKAEGELLAAFPIEGGLLYQIGRRLSSKRYMEKKYRIDYDAIVRWEHCNGFGIILEALRRKFVIRKNRFFPFPFWPWHHVNVIQCLRASPKHLDSMTGRIA